jgi:hypothetical protein
VPSSRHFSITAARECRERPLDRLRVDVAHQTADVLALAGEGGPAAQAVHFEDRFEQGFGQLQMLLQLAQLLRPHPRQSDAKFLQRFGVALARRAARALDGAACLIALLAASEGGSRFRCIGGA